MMGMCLLLSPTLLLGGADVGGTGTWASLAPAPSKRTEVAAAAVSGKIYVVGGFSEPGLDNLSSLAITDTVEEYDPAADRWTTKAPLPAKLHHAGAVGLDGKLYVVGGYTKSFLNIWHPVATLYMYDPSTDTWVERAPMPTARGALGATVSEGLLYAIGGYDQSQNVGAVEVYDPATNTWMTRAPLPTPRDHLTVAAVGSRIYAIGGRLKGKPANNLSITEAYDPQSNRWTKVRDMPTARSGIASGVIRNTLYVLGGEAPEGTFNENEAYRPDLDRWSSAPPMSGGRHGLGAAVIQDRLFVMAGGPTPGGSFSNINEVFTPPRDSAGNDGNRQPQSRAASALVGTVMALLAAFSDADALPPESSPEANRLIKALIQFQAAFVKSGNPAIQRLLFDALGNVQGDRGTAVEEFRAHGWSSRSMEAIVEYVRATHAWQQPEVIEGFRPYNVGAADFELLSDTFQTARSKLAARGEDLHAVYAARRREMPGARL